MGLDFVVDLVVLGGVVDGDGVVALGAGADVLARQCSEPPHQMPYILSRG